MLRPEFGVAFVARIVLLDLAVFCTCGSDLDEIGPLLTDILIGGYGL
jgi:hypothetical protein